MAVTPQAAMLTVSVLVAVQLGRATVAPAPIVTFVRHPQAVTVAMPAIDVLMVVMPGRRQ